MRPGSLLAALLTLPLASAPPPTGPYGAAPASAADTSLHFQPPRFAREQMQAASPARPWRFVYGTREPGMVSALHAQARFVAVRLFGADSSQVCADRELGATDAASHSLVLIGGPRDNAWSERLGPALPVEFTRAGFRWRGHDYDRASDALSLAYPNPLDPLAFVLLVHANSPEALSLGAGLGLGGDDWRIVRAGECWRAGSFAQSGGRPWRYEPALDRDREQELQAYERTLVSTGRDLVVRAPIELPWAKAVQAAGERVLERMTRAGLGPATAHAPVVLTLYPSIERKGVLVRNSRPEQLERDSARVAALAGRSTCDLWCVAAGRLVQIGASEASRFLVPAAVSWSARFEGDPFELALSRPYLGMLLPNAAAAATRDDRWRSPRVWTPARALLVRALWDVAPLSRRRGALLSWLATDPPGTLDSLAALAGVERARLATRYHRLADSLGWVARREAMRVPASGWTSRDGFVRGVCLVHSSGIEHGYASSRARAEIESLPDLGFSAVSLSPLAYRSPDGGAALGPSALGGPDEETDEALAEATARSHEAGLRVWLEPRLWSRDGSHAPMPVGAEGSRLFEQYRSYVLHVALLADQLGASGLVLGAGVRSLAPGTAARARSLVADVRRVYSGAIAWDAPMEEAEGITFWDALDVVAVSFDAPLADEPTRDAARLAAGAERALARVRAVAVRVGRPLLLAEVGYPARADAALRPWDDSGPPDAEAQQRCWQALLAATDPAEEVMGLNVWKWFTSPGRSGAGVAFSPQGASAQVTISRAIRRWAGRPVRVREPSR